MQTYKVFFSDNYCARTLRAESPEDARAKVLSERAGAKVERVDLVHEPAFLSRWRDDVARRMGKGSAAPVIDPAFNRSSFVRVSVDIEDMLKWMPRGCGHRATFGDIDNAISDGVDLWACFSGPLDDMDKAIELTRHLCPDMPARVVEEMREEIEDSLRVAMVRAAEDDYRSQFTDWLREAVTRLADGAGVPWAWHDGKEASAYPWDADRIMFALSRRAYLKGGEWEARQSWETQREYMDRAEDVLSEYVNDETRAKIDLSHFDERGSVYADPRDWPEHFIESANVVDEWRESVKKMRAKLRGMIASRAPLEARAALVATVYGAPGSTIGEDA